MKLHIGKITWGGGSGVSSGPSIARLQLFLILSFSARMISSWEKVDGRSATVVEIDAASSIWFFMPLYKTTHRSIV